MKPLNDRAFVRFDEAAKQTPGGLFLPDQAQEKPRTGVVVSVGPGKTQNDGMLIPPNVQPGDKVLLSNYHGDNVFVDGVEHVFVKFEDILGVME